ncbi:MAG: hypothetical protein ACK41W_10945 [Cyanobacteriota bacterium]
MADPPGTTKVALTPPDRLDPFAPAKRLGGWRGAGFAAGHERRSFDQPPRS